MTPEELNEMSDDDMVDLMFQLGAKLKENMEPNEYEQHCLDLRYA